MKEDGTYAVRLLREPLAHAEPEAPQAEQGTAPPPPRRSEVLRDAHALVAQFEAQQRAGRAGQRAAAAGQNDTRITFYIIILEIGAKLWTHELDTK